MTEPTPGMRAASMGPAAAKSPWMLGSAPSTMSVKVEARATASGSVVVGNLYSQGWTGRAPRAERDVLANKVCFGEK